ncbi:SusC/RagA family TonB-linked outer membrane protein [Parapedobacter tibetensis]|uniref:SusC/RagA family TonB-linked outer membrane protein n=1 Tax=Parapedobacter tibetensis TaxID=2972951 RepID=UPI00214DC2FA|nr:SusC/RagA family TonB-linked outer membrane protein [Parapedobacter tibetensis]
MKTTISLILFLCFAGMAAFSQQEVMGVVRSAEDRASLSGANVRSISSGGSATTDSEGRFRLSVSAGTDTIQVTYIGYITQRIPINKMRIPETIEIYLEADASTLEEVVINTGYYKVPKERATGSFTHVDNSLLNRSVGSNILQRLEGIAPGVQFVNANGASASDIRVRGVATIESDETPLIVVDNFPYEGDINSINPNDVESITVLRDAAAASIWGARAGNGVIVITTKQGRYNQRAKISVNSNFTMGEKPDLFYSQSWLPSATVMDIEKELFERGGYYLESTNQRPFPAYVELLIKHKNGSIDDAELARQEAIMRKTDVRNEAMRHLYRGESHQQYAINISGGGERYRYYLSTGYDQNRSILVGNGNNRLNMNLQNTFQPIDGLEITAGIWYAQQRATNNGLSLSNLNPAAAQQVSTYVRLADEQGNTLAIPHERRLAYYDRAEADGLLDWHYRPLDELQLTDNTSTGNEYRLNAALRYRFLDHFNLNVTYQYLQSSSTGKNYYDADSYFVRNLVNRFTQADGSRMVPHGAILDGGRNTVGRSQSGRAQLNYSRDFGSDHSVTALTGAEIREAVSESSPGYRIYNFDRELLTGTATYNYNQAYPVRPSGSSRLPTPPTGLTHYTDRYLSYFGNAAYTYTGRYTLSGSLRWDGSNLFGVKTNQKGVPLWSIGGSWNASKEPFYGLGDILPYLRLRATYGSAGNVNKQVSVFPVVRFTTNSTTGLPVANVQSVGNPSLRWEQVNTLNFGVDFASRNNRIQGNVEYYTKYAEDLIGEDFMAPSTGINSAARLSNQINYANLRTHGWDVQVTTRNLTGVLNWQTGFQFSHVRNKVTHFSTAEVNTIGTYFTNPPPVIGQSRDAVYALPWHGLDGDTGMPLVDVDGQMGMDYDAYIRNYDADKLLIAGMRVPPFYGALRNTLEWKGVQVGVNIVWKAGYVFRRQSISPGQEYSTSGYHIDYFRRWQRPGDELHTDVPAWAETVQPYRSQSYLYSEALITDGDQIRLQDVNLSYDLPVNQTLLLRRMRLYAYARNLGILWKANQDDIDPDYVNAEYIAPRMFSVGVQVDF